MHSHFFKKKSASHFSHRARGFTLVELLLVVLLISMISFSIYMALNNGLKVWEKSKKIYGEEDALIFFDKLSTDLNSSFVHSKIKYVGDEDQFAFPTTIRASNTNTFKSDVESDNVYETSIGQVEYYYDMLKQAVFRRQASYGQVQDYTFDPPQRLVGNVKSMKIKYVYVTDDGEILSDATLDTFPMGLEIEIQIIDGKNVKSLKKLINIPLRMN